MANENKIAPPEATGKGNNAIQNRFQSIINSAQDASGEISVETCETVDCLDLELRQALACLSAWREDDAVLIYAAENLIMLSLEKHRAVVAAYYQQRQESQTIQ